MAHSSSSAVAVEKLECRRGAAALQHGDTMVPLNTKYPGFMEKFSKNTEMQATDWPYNVLPHRSMLITSSLLNSEEGMDGRWWIRRN